jgi:hypothetical protein
MSSQYVRPYLHLPHYTWTNTQSVLDLQLCNLHYFGLTMVRKYAVEILFQILIFPQAGNVEQWL